MISSKIHDQVYKNEFCRIFEEEMQSSPLRIDLLMASSKALQIISSSTILTVQPGFSLRTPSDVAQP